MEAACRTSVRLAEAKDVFKNGRASPHREILLTALGIAVTLTATGFTAGEVWTLLRAGYAGGSWIAVLEQVAFASIVAGLVFANLDYQVSRLAYYRRLPRHAPVLRS